MLYSDDDDVIYQFARAAIINGINIPGTSPDLLDRSILIQMDRIEESERRDRSSLWAQFESARPRIFGAILDTLSAAIKIRPSIKLHRLPRMADWTLWGCAIAEALGIGQEAFLEAYAGNRRSQNDEVVSADVVAATLIEFLDGREEWSGSPSELHLELNKIAEEHGTTKERHWPKSPEALSRRLTTLSHNLKEAGLVVEKGWSGRGRDKRRSLTITRPDRDPDLPSPPSYRPQMAPEATEGGNAMGTQLDLHCNTVPIPSPPNPAESLDGDAVDAGDAISGNSAGHDLLASRGCLKCNFLVRPSAIEARCKYRNPPTDLFDPAIVCPFKGPSKRGML
jgi:hypothetical protein